MKGQQKFKDTLHKKWGKRNYSFETVSYPHSFSNSDNFSIQLITTLETIFPDFIGIKY